MDKKKYNSVVINLGRSWIDSDNEPRKNIEYIFLWKLLCNMFLSHMNIKAHFNIECASVFSILNIY